MLKRSVKLQVVKPAVAVRKGTEAFDSEYQKSNVYEVVGHERMYKPPGLEIFVLVTLIDGKPPLAVPVHIDVTCFQTAWSK